METRRIHSIDRHASSFVFLQSFVAVMTSLVVMTTAAGVVQVNDWQPTDGDDVMIPNRGVTALETGPEVHTDAANETMLSEAEVERLFNEHRLMMEKKSNFDPVTQVVLVTLFVCLIVFGAVGNGLVCYVVVANSHMRSPRNILILNLAVSDLILCCLTQPFNLTKVSIPTWNLGEVLCKLVPMMAGTNVFVSTITITAIALDRFHLIVHPTEKDLLTVRPGATALAIAIIWTLSVLASSPLLVFCSTESVEPIPGLQYEVCVESPDLHYVKASYSVVSALCQYVMPILIVSVAHAQICGKLRARMNVSKPSVMISSSKTSGYFTQVNSSAVVVTDTSCTLAVSPPQSTMTSPSPSRLAPPIGCRKLKAVSSSMTLSEPSSPGGAVTPTSVTFQALRQRKEASRKRKTNRLLVAIAVIFAGSWLPLNAYNIIADFNQSWLMSLVDTNRSATIIAVCHLLVLCSACANPVLYGWLNDNFRREFVAVLCPTRLASGRSSASCFRRHSAADPSPPSTGSVIVVARRRSSSRARPSIDGNRASARSRDSRNGRVGSVERRRHQLVLTHGRHGNDCIVRPGEVVPPPECSSSLSKNRDVLPQHAVTDRPEVLVVNDSLDGSDHEVPEVRCHNSVSALVINADVTSVDPGVRDTDAAHKSVE